MALLLTLQQTSLASLDIPLHTTTHAQRRTLPSRVLSILGDLQCTSVFANIEYEVDELRRDISICALAKSQGIKATFVHDKCIVDPGDVLTKQDKTYTVRSPHIRICCKPRPNVNRAGVQPLSTKLALEIERKPTVLPRRMSCSLSE